MAVRIRSESVRIRLCSNPNLLVFVSKIGPASLRQRNFGRRSGVSMAYNSFNKNCKNKGDRRQNREDRQSQKTEPDRDGWGERGGGNGVGRCVFGVCCLFACMPACLHASVLACLHACLHACLPVFFGNGNHSGRPACMPACLPAYLPARLIYVRKPIVGRRTHTIRLIAAKEYTRMSKLGSSAAPYLCRRPPRT